MRLTNLTKKNQRYEWLEEQQRAFELLCAMIMTAPVLHRLDPNGLFVVQTDASDVGLGAVLLQEVEAQERVLEFASRVLTPADGPSRKQMGKKKKRHASIEGRRGHVVDRRDTQQVCSVFFFRDTVVMPNELHLHHCNRQSTCASTNHEGLGVEREAERDGRATVRAERRETPFPPLFSGGVGEREREEYRAMAGRPQVSCI